MKSKTKRFQKWLASKGGKGVIIGTSAFLLTGLLCLVLGYGFSLGWEVVGAWFTSQWAIYVYIAIGVWVILVLYLWHWGKNFGDDK